jgi:MHS family alpha-ketoglutarate permease-like MFS transporter
MQKYLVNTAGMHANVASGIMTAALCVFMLVQPLFGALSDKIGRRTSMLCFGALAAIFTVPILTALQSVTSPYMAFALVMCALLIVSFYTSISGILKAEMFPAQVRALGVGLSYAVANALFGGSAEYVALSLSVGMETTFFWYVTALAVVAFLVSLMLQGRERSAPLVMCQLPDRIAGRRACNIPGESFQLQPLPAGRLSTVLLTRPG